MNVDAYVAVLQEFFHLVGRLWLARVEAELWKFAEALDGWLHELFAHPTPEWRERLDRFLAEQEAAGRIAAPQSRQELIEFLAGWEKTINWKILGGSVTGDGRAIAALEKDRTSPASYSARKQIAVQLVSTRKGVGHHWAPKAVVFDPEILPFLSDDATAYAMGSYSGPTDPSHNYGTFGGVTHREYNELVKKELKRFIDYRKIKKMTAGQMEHFIELIDKGVDVFGEEHPRISAFNDAIRKTVRKGTDVPKTMESIIKAGRKYMKHPRFRLLVAGAAISSLLGEVVAQQAKLLKVAAKSGHYRRAVRALQDGDLVRARQLLTGDRNSLYMEILTQVGAHAALNFRAAIDKIFESARDGD